jgi:tRNA pseudouridine55 synthase
MLTKYLSGNKRYQGTAILGIETDSQDSTGTVIRELDPSLTNAITYDQINAILPEFIGENILQTPPMHSALKKDGKRLYTLARQGITVERQPRPISIYDLRLIHHKDCNGDGGDDGHDGFDLPGLPYFHIDVTCGGGTYVRSLLLDIASHKSISSTAHMTALVRTRQGPFSLEDCLLPSELASYETIIANIIKCTNQVGMNALNDLPPAIETNKPSPSLVKTMTQDWK